MYVSCMSTSDRLMRISSTTDIAVECKLSVVDIQLYLAMLLVGGWSVGVVNEYFT